MRTILVVDDCPSGRLRLQRILSGEGYRVITSPNGADALACLRLVRIDLVLCEARLPVIDGIDTCGYLQGAARYADMPIILIGAPGLPPIPERLYTAFLSKPLPLPTLCCLVARAAGKGAEQLAA